ncbi:hypothetical protein C8R45DRAFT_931338 [Mycena sanguinolenta]|nr:hypothetical protein C8R45DRAFT_931338 [Mycena sanguinolenta]
MPDHRPYKPAMRSGTTISFVKGRVYTDIGPALYPIPVLSIQLRPNETDSLDPYDYPSVEAVMQPTPGHPAVIHDVIVWIKHRLPSGRLKYTRFRCFLKISSQLPRNRGLGIRGDLVVMKLAARHRRGIVNLMSADDRLVDFAVARLLRKIDRVSKPLPYEMRRLVEVLVPPVKRSAVYTWRRKADDEEEIFQTAATGKWGLLRLFEVSPGSSKLLLVIVATVSGSRTGTEKDGIMICVFSASGLGFASFLLVSLSVIAAIPSSATAMSTSGSRLPPLTMHTKLRYLPAEKVPIFGDCRHRLSATTMSTSASHLLVQPCSQCVSPLMRLLGGLLAEQVPISGLSSQQFPKEFMNVENFNTPSRPLMPDHRPYKPAMRPGMTMSLVRGRVYTSVRAPGLYPIPVISIQPQPNESNSRNPYDYPSVEAVMRLIPEYPAVIHDVVVWVKHRLPSGRLNYSRFHCFLNISTHLPMNFNLGIRSELVVMKLSARSGRGIVNMVSADQYLVDFAVAWYTHFSPHFSPTLKFIQLAAQSS